MKNPFRRATPPPFVPMQLPPPVRVRIIMDNGEKIDSQFHGGASALSYELSWRGPSLFYIPIAGIAVNAAHVIAIENIYEQAEA